MTGVYCFSGTGHSLAAARFFADRLHTEVTRIGRESPALPLRCDTAVVVFPVYCQNIPAPVRRFLRRTDAAYFVLVAVYGRISYGRVLRDAQKMVRGTVIAGAYVPTGHTFRREDGSFDAEPLLPILERIAHPQPVRIPRTHKDLFADLLPAWRSRVGVKLIRTDACTGCDRCGRHCPTGAIRRGKGNSRCIRCLRCVTECPTGALTFQNRAVLQKYLDTHYRSETVVYL